MIRIARALSADLLLSKILHLHAWRANLRRSSTRVENFSGPARANLTQMFLSEKSETGVGRGAQNSPTRPLFSARTGGRGPVLRPGR